VLYKSGTWLEQENAPKDGADCGVGLHLGRDFIGAGNYHMPEKIFFCLYDKKDECGSGKDKVRISRLLPLTELPQWLGYGLNGKKIVSKIGKKIDPEKYNPYHAKKLPTIASLKKTGLRAQVWDQVGAQVGAQVWDQVWAQVGAQVRAQVWDQVGATSYWSINIHFGLGITHWFGDFLSLGVMPIFVKGKVKFFGEKGMYLGEYDEKELLD
jgi:hypothetical protein